MAYCQKCGKELAAGAKFCVECGEAVPTPIVTVEEPRMAENAVNAESMQNTENTQSTESTQNTENTQSTESTQNTQSIENTQNTQSTENTQSAEKTQNTGSTQSMGNTQYTSNTQYTGNQQPLYDQRKSRTLAGILGIFFGIFGVHNFYLDYTSKAVIQLCVSLVGIILSCFGIGVFIAGGIAIWGLVEGIMILAGSINVDGKGIPLRD